MEPGGYLNESYTTTVSLSSVKKKLCLEVIWTDKRTDTQTDGQTNGRTDKLMDRHGDSYIPQSFVVADTYIVIWVKFDEHSFPLEAEFSNFGPGECVNFGVGLKH